MKIQSIALESFMMIDSAEIELPSRGIVLVTGENGVGKSSLIESVPVALYGKTLRGTPWWRGGDEAASRASVTFDDGKCATRTRKGTKNKLSIEGIERGEHDTATKAQELLSKLIPSLDVWKKTSVFSSAAVEGEHFTSGSDGERKRLLEAVLAIDKFDAALDRCRVDAKQYDAALAQSELARTIAKTKIEAEQKRRDEAVARRADFKDGKAPSSKAKDVAVTLGKLRPDLERLLKDEHNAGRKVGMQDSDLRAAKTRLSFIENGKCPTCEQNVPVEQIAELKAKVVKLVKEAKLRHDASDVELEGVRAELEELQDTVNELEAQRRALLKHAEAHKERTQEKDRNERIIADAELAITRIMVDKSNAVRTIKRAKSELLILGAVESVLGLKGVRAHVLSHTLAGLARVSNNWLETIGTDISIGLSPYTEKKTGGHSDAIAVTIDGAGGGYGYAACSAGQRRLVDVALILGLATLATVAFGLTESTLFFDEVFDVLDPTNAQGVARAIQQLSRERCVVVVTHSHVLSKALTADRHLHVEKGTVYEL